MCIFHLKRAINMAFGLNERVYLHLSLQKLTFYWVYASQCHNILKGKVQKLGIATQRQFSTTHCIHRLIANFDILEWHSHIKISIKSTIDIYIYTKITKSKFLCINFKAMINSS